MVDRKIIPYTGQPVRNIVVDTTFLKNVNVADLRIFWVKRAYVDNEILKTILRPVFRERLIYHSHRITLYARERFTRQFVIQPSKIFLKRK